MPRRARLKPMTSQWQLTCTALLAWKRLFTHTRLTALFPGLPRWAGTRKVKPIWILLKQETMSGSGISWAICKSAPRSRQITMPAPHHSVFYRPDALPDAQLTASKHWRQTVDPLILTYDLDFQCPASYCHDPYTRKRSTSKVSLFNRQSGNKASTDRRPGSGWSSVGGCRLSASPGAACQTAGHGRRSTARSWAWWRSSCTCRGRDTRWTAKCGTTRGTSRASGVAGRSRPHQHPCAAPAHTTSTQTV